MGLKRWTGSGYADVNLAKYGASTIPKNAYVWNGSAYKKVWPLTPTNPMVASSPDYWYKLDNMNLSNSGTKSAPLTFNTAANFVNMGDHVDINGAAPRINTTEPWNGSFSVSMWLERTNSTSPSGEYLFYRGGMTAGTASLWFLIPSHVAGSENQIYFQYHDGTTLSGWYTTTAGILPPPGSGWFHLVVTCEVLQGRNALRFYVNGVEVASAWVDTTYAPLSFASTNQTFIANEPSGALPFKGRMDDPAVWSRTLPASEIQAIYAAGRSTAPAITTIEIPSVRQGRNYNLVTFQANFPVTTWSATGLPAGISINSSTGTLAGYAPAASSGTATITATGASGQSTSRSYPWLIYASVEFSAPFNSNADITTFFPTRGFDSRTSASSPKNAGWIYNGMLVAGDNSQPTYWDLLNNNQFKYDLEVILQTGDAVPTVHPLGLIISSDLDLTYQIILEIKSDNLRLVHRTTGAATQIRSFNTTDGGANKPVRIVRSGSTLSVYANGSLKFTEDLSPYPYWNRPTGGYVGISMYSASNVWCGRVDAFTARNII